MTKRQFILQYLTDNLMMSSWDWKADVAYADEFYPDLKELGERLLAGSSPDTLKMAIHGSHFAVAKRDRLKTLRKLVNEGLVSSSWVGAGFDSVRKYGINRVRSYEITNEGKIELKTLTP